jgi:hypothetical protein
MSTIELRSSIHKIVDSIQNEQLLQTLYEFLKTRETTAQGVWPTLNDDEKKEILLAFDESEDDKNLIDKNKIFMKPG